MSPAARPASNVLFNFGHRLVALRALTPVQTVSERMSSATVRVRGGVGDLLKVILLQVSLLAAVRLMRHAL
jgi:hypothetical protein